MEKDMNFIDLCVACGRAIGRGCKACGRILARMTRLTYRYYWVVLPIILLGLAASLYYTREKNTINRANAIVMVNAGSLQQFEQAFAPLRLEKSIPAEFAIKGFLKRHKALRFETFHVIDSKHDGTADFIDFKKKVKATDTTEIIMQDRICIQFFIKDRDLDSLPQIEKAVLDYLNANEALQQSYGIYLANLRESAAFNHTQAMKLDSLTSHYYFRGHLGKNSFGQMQQGTVVMSDWGGDWRVRLFLDEIYKQHGHIQRTDYRLHLATAPVVLENHFTLDPKPVNGRIKFGVFFLLLGWAAGCALAELIDRRKAILTWLQQ